MYWELWHEPSANLIDSYSSLDEALEVVWQELRERGADALAGWALMAGDGEVAPLRDDDLRLTAFVACGAGQPGTSLPERLTNVERRMQSLESRVQELSAADRP